MSQDVEQAAVAGPVTGEVTDQVPGQATGAGAGGVGGTAAGGIPGGRDGSVTVPAARPPVDRRAGSPALQVRAGTPRDAHPLLGAPSSVVRTATRSPDPDVATAYVAHSLDLALSGSGTGVLAQPAAVAALSRHYVLRRVAGSSAGAVTAALAAAAEVGRTADGSEGDDGTGARDPFAVVPGFAGLDQTLDRLADLDHPAGLIAPRRGAGGAFALVLAVRQGRWRTAASTLLFGFAPWTRPVTTLAGIGAVALTAAVPALLLGAPGVPWWLAGLLTLGSLVAGSLATAAVAAAAGLAAARSWWRAQVGSGEPFGLVDGVSAAPGLPSAGDVLAGTLDRLAGLHTDGTGADGTGAERLLTFGDLWLGRPATPADAARLRLAADDPDERVVDLRLHVTDLVAGTSLRFPPARGDAAERRGDPRLLFCATCLRTVLPERVVRAVVAASPALEVDHRCPRHDDGATDRTASSGLLRELPDPWDLPVVLAVRAAAAVPGLVTPLPLASVRRDGRLVPLHLVDGELTDPAAADTFDSPLPRWPTFSLRAAPEVAPDADGDAGRLARRVVSAVLGHRERTTAGRPGHRDRSVLLGTGSSRPGTALLADAPAVRAAAAAGRAAGEDLVARFTGPDGGPDGIDGQTLTDRYRWIRLRSALDGYRRLSLDIATRLPVYTDLVGRYRVPGDLTGWFDAPPEPGVRDPAWADAAATLTALRALSAGGVLAWDTSDGAPPTPTQPPTPTLP